MPDPGRHPDPSPDPGAGPDRDPPPGLDTTRERGLVRMYVMAMPGLFGLAGSVHARTPNDTPSAESQVAVRLAIMKPIMIVGAPLRDAD